MPDYLVTYEIEVFDARTPKDAAEMALEIIRDPDSETLVFEVEEFPRPNVHFIDLAK